LIRGIYATHIVMENPNHPNDPNVPEGEQAPAAPDGFAPQWICEHDPNNNNGWIKWDVPLGGELDEPMIDPDVNEEVMDDDDWDDEVKWLMAPVTPPRATMIVRAPTRLEGDLPQSGYCGGAGTGDGIIDRANMQGQEVIVGSSKQVQTLQTALHETELQNQQLQTRVTEMESHAGVVMSHMLWMEERLTVLEKRLPGPPPGP
nr:hypothetical protein [Tanacetum cinerariifolium]